jgi:hypothetical protein
MNALQPLAMPIPLRMVWILLGIPLAVVLSLGAVWHMRPAAYRYRDLTQDWLSARCYFEGRSIYLPHRDSVPRHLGYEDAGRDWNVAINAHPPVSVLVLLPLGRLSHDAAILGWNLLSLVLLAWAAWIVLGPKGLNCHTWYVVAACSLLAASTPLAAQAATAQLNPLLLLLIALSWSSDRQGRPLTAGALLGLAAGVKLFPAFLLVYFLGTRRWLAVAAALATMALLHAAAVLVFGWHDVLYYFQHVVPEVGTWRSAWLNCSLAGFWSRLFDVTDPGTREWFHSPQLARLLTLASSAALTVLVFWRSWWAQRGAERDLAFAAATIAMLLVSPVTWDHSLLLLLLPVAIVWYYQAGSLTMQALLAALLLVPGYIPACHLWQLLLEPASLPVLSRVADPATAVFGLALVTYCLLGLVALALFNNPPQPLQQGAADACPGS